MKPLDLRRRPPRGPRETMLGLCFLPRTIDKVRAFLPGGNPGEYFVNEPLGMSAYILSRIEIDPDALSDAVAAAETEIEVEAWIAAYAKLGRVEELNLRISAVTVGMLGSEHLALMRRYYANVDSLPKNLTIFEFIEADDARLRPAGATTGE